MGKTKQRYYTMQQLADYFGLSRKQMERHIRAQGILPSLSMGHPRYDIFEIEETFRNPQKDIVLQRVSAMLEDEA